MANNVTIVIAAKDTATEQLRRLVGELNSVNTATGRMAAGAGNAGAVMSSAFGTMNTAAGMLRNTISSAAGFALAQLLGDAANSVSGLATEFVNLNAKMEQTRIAYTTMLGSSGMANQFIREMEDFAAKTPFEFADVDKAAKKFLAFGMEAKNIIPTLTAVGDAAAALGLSGEGIDRITLALGQMSMKSKLSAEEVRQLNEAGISAQKYLAEAFHLTAKDFDDLSKTGITGLQGMQAIIQAMANDPKFKGMMSEQAKTMLGVLSTLKDNTKIIMRELGTGMFEAVKSSLGNLSDDVSKFADTIRNSGVRAALSSIIGDEWTQKLYDAAGAMVSLGQSFTNLAVAAAPIVARVGGELLPILTTTVNVASDIVNALAYVVGGMDNLSGVISTAIIGWGIYKTTLFAVTTAQQAYSAGTEMLRGGLLYLAEAHYSNIAAATANTAAIESQAIATAEQTAMTTTLAESSTVAAIAVRAESAANLVAAEAKMAAAAAAAEAALANEAMALSSGLLTAAEEAQTIAATEAALALQAQTAAEYEAATAAATATGAIGEMTVATGLASTAGGAASTGGLAMFASRLNIIVGIAAAATYGIYELTNALSEWYVAQGENSVVNQRGIYSPFTGENYKDLQKKEDQKFAESINTNIGWGNGVPVNLQSEMSKKAQQAQRSAGLISLPKVDFSTQKPFVEGGGESDGKKAAQKAQDEAKKLNSIISNINTEIAAKSETAYSAAFAKLGDKASDLRAQLAELTTVDTSGALAAVTKMVDDVGKTITDVWRDSWRNAKADVALVMAQITGNVFSISEAEYQKALLDNKSKAEEMRKQIAQSQGDTVANEFAANYKLKLDEQSLKDFNDKTKKARDDISSLRLDTAAAFATLTGNYMESTSVAYEKTMENIRKEYDEKVKLYGKSVELAKWRAGQELLADRELQNQRLSRERALFDIQQQISQLKYGNITPDQSLAMNELSIGKKEMYQQYGITDDTQSKLRSDIDELFRLKELIATGGVPADSIFGAMTYGIHQASAEWGQTFKQISDFGTAATNSIQQSFSSVIGDTLTGDLQNFNSYLSSLWQSIANDFADMCGKMVTKFITSTETMEAVWSGLKFAGSWIGGLLGFAKGGAVYAGQTVMVNEQGPEIFEPNGNGMPFLISSAGPVLFTPPEDGEIIPNEDLPKYAGRMLAGARAAGGPVSGGKTYLTNERGVEGFVPASAIARSGGTVIQNAGTTIYIEPKITVVNQSGAAGQNEQPQFDWKLLNDYIVNGICAAMRINKNNINVQMAMAVKGVS